jgi:hypothetical protein
MKIKRSLLGGTVSTLLLGPLGTSGKLTQDGQTLKLGLKVWSEITTSLADIGERLRSGIGILLYHHHASWHHLRDDGLGIPDKRRMMP